MGETLKLRACDAEDLKVISTYLQDAAVPVEEMNFFADESRFAMVASRFRWENCENKAEEGCAKYERIRCGLCIEGVSAVQTKQLDCKATDVVLDLLAVVEDGGYLQLMFAGGPAIRLKIDGINCHLQDIGEPWPTHWRPDHSSAVQEANT